MNRPLRVLLVSPLPPPAGGIARWTRLILDFSETRTDVSLGLINTALRRRTIQQNSKRARILAGIPQLLGCVKTFAAAAARRKVDLLHINASGEFSVFRDLALACVGRAFRVPFVYHIRFGRVPTISARSNIEWKILSTVIRMSQATIALDQLTLDTVRDRLPKVPSFKIPNFVDADIAAEPKRTGPVDEIIEYLLFVGWVIPAKGVEELFSVWREIAPQGWKLRVVGSYDQSYLRSIGASPGQDANIEFLGERPHAEVLALMSGCQMFVLPSHTEGFPNSILEAMSLGTAVLSTNVGAVSEMLSGGCGVVVEPKNSADLRDALASLLASPSRRIELGARARAKVESEYSIKSVFERYVEIWGDATLSRRKPSGRR